MFLGSWADSGGRRLANVRRIEKAFQYSHSAQLRNEKAGEFLAFVKAIAARLELRLGQKTKLLQRSHTSSRPSYSTIRTFSRRSTVVPVKHIFRQLDVHVT